MRLTAWPSLAAVTSSLATASTIDALVPAAVEHDHASCSARCGATFSASGPSAICDQVCALVQDQPEFYQCRQDLLDATVEHATLLSYNSGHVYESLSILQGSSESKNSTDPALVEYATFMDEYHLNDRGSPAGCADMQDAHYCVAQAPLFASIGLCLPKSCNSAFVGAVIANISDDTGGFQPNFLQLQNGGGGGASGVLGGPSISCGEELRVRPDAGTTAVFGLMAVLVVLTLAGTAIDYHARGRAERQQKGDSGSKTTTIINGNRMGAAAAAAAAATTGNGAMAAAVFCPITDALITVTPTAWPPRGGSSEESKEGEDQQQAEEVATTDEDSYSGDPAQQPLLSPAEAAAAAEEGNYGGDGGSGSDGQQEPEHNAGSESIILARLRRMRKSEWGRWSIERVQCFSLIINANSLLAPPRVADEFPALDGVRTMSMMWVVLGHTFAYNVTGGGPGFTNTIAVIPTGGKGFMARLSAQVIPGGFMAVDTFFLMSGFLLSSVLLPKLESGSLTGGGGGVNGNLGNSWMLKTYVHRYLRLTPTLFFVTLMFWKVLPLLGDGAGWWPVADAQEEACRKYWWTEITYLSSVIPWPPLSDGCTGVSWYLADDTMYFLLGVPIIALYHRRPRFSAILVFIIAACSCTFTFLWYGFHQNISFSLFTRVINSDGWGTVYAAPWARCPAYLVGMLCGMVWHSHFRGRVDIPGGASAGSGAIMNGGIGGGRHAASGGGGGEAAAGPRTLIKNPLERYAKPGALVSWPVALVTLASAALLALPVYGTYWDYQDAREPHLTPWADHMYLAFSRPAWALGVALMCMLCFCGHGGLVNWVLTRPGWTTLSRLTYCAYLFHTLLLTVLYGSRDQPIELTGLEFAVTYMGIVFGTFLGATGLHLLVEAPFRNLESISRRQKQKQLRTMGHKS